MGTVEAPATPSKRRYPSTAGTVILPGEQRLLPPLPFASLRQPQILMVHFPHLQLLVDDLTDSGEAATGLLLLSEDPLLGIVHHAVI